MWLIADSGSTKTEWILFDESGERKKLFSRGLNPLFLSEEEFKYEVEKAISSNERLEITKLWFYAAGCGSEAINSKTALWLTAILKNAIIKVDSDMLAAARATCSTSSGLVAILGTGSNSCFYDGRIVKDQIKPLGFILGDEGSGAALGKALLQKLLRNQFSPQLTALVYKEIGLDYDGIIAKLYHSSWPSRFLASCAKVMFNHKHENEIEQLIEAEFDRFSNVLKGYNNSSSVNIIGSIGFYFEEQIRTSLQKNGLDIGVIIKSPAVSLIDYHLEND